MPDSDLIGLVSLLFEVLQVIPLAAGGCGSQGLGVQRRWLLGRRARLQPPSCTQGTGLQAEMPDCIQSCEIDAVIIPFDRWRNEGSEKLSHLLQVTQLRLSEREFGLQHSVM